MKSIDPWDFIEVSPSGDVYYPGNVYEHPFYQEVPSWIHYGPSSDTTRQLFDGAFIGADYAGAGMRNIGGITFKKELDAQQVLHVEICVDGKCHRTAMDLAPAIAMVMDKLAKWHLERHALTDPKLVVGAVEAAIGEAGDALIVTLIDRHARNSRVTVGDIWDDIGSALKDLKGPIAAAAGAAATYYGGPAAGKAASQIAGSLVDAAPGGHPAKQAAAQQTVAAAKKAAQTNPTVQTALAAANHATSQTTAAVLGQPTPPAAPNTVAAMVQKFLPLAVKAATSQGTGGDSSLSSGLQSALSAFGSSLGDGGGATVSGYPPVIVGDFWDDVGNAFLTVSLIKPTNQFIHDNHLEGVVQAAAGAVATIYGGPAAGAAAGALAPSMMSLGVDDKKKAKAAQKTVTAVKTAAQQAGPQQAQIVDAAHNAVKHTAAAYQTAQVVRDAKAGVPQAQAAIANLQTAAANGDPNATKALQAAALIDQAQQAVPPAPGGTVASGWYDLVGVIVGAEAYYASTTHPMIGACPCAH